MSSMYIIWIAKVSQSRRLLSTSTMPHSDYARSICKKFLMQVHPDFFQQHKFEQRINDTNIKVLTNAIDVAAKSGNPVTSSAQDARTLIFYIKPICEKFSPRRVKISLTRMIESIREILETIGVELPPRPEEAPRAAFITSDPEEVASLLDSLIDRKELMAWRFERSEDFSRLIDRASAQLGLTSIDFRFGWSAQNKTVLLHSILSTVEHHRDDFQLPWTGLTLVLTHDDSNHTPVDPMEGCVFLNPAHVPVQWISTFNAVTAEVVSSAHTLREQEERHARRLRLLLTVFLRRELRQQSFESTPGDLLSHLHVHVRRGFTCRALAYSRFLSSHTETLAHTANTAPIPSDDDSHAIPDMSEETGGGKEDGGGDGDGSWQSSAGLQLRDIVVTIVVEEGHGTKLLSSGDLRVDCRCSTEDLVVLLTSKARESAAQSLHREELRARVTMLSDDLRGELGVLSVDAGVGVDLHMMNDCLSRMDDYRSRRRHWGHFRNLSGVRLRVGKYLGIADDGAVILPWNWEL